MPAPTDSLNAISNMDIYEAMWKQLQEELKAKSKWTTDELEHKMLQLKSSYLDVMLEQMRKQEQGK